MKLQIHKKLPLLAVGTFMTFTSYAQQTASEVSTEFNEKETTYYDWFNQDLAQNKHIGVSTNKAYTDLLKDKKSKTVVVAVLDSGIDIDHEDLQDNIWVNEDEIPNNGIDDDNNGYIDDVNGWNFLGSSTGENLESTNLEYVRVLKSLNEKVAKEESLTKAEKALHKELLELHTKEYAKFSERLKEEEETYNKLKYVHEICIEATGVESYTVEDLKKVDTEDEDTLKAIELMSGILEQGASFNALSYRYKYFYTYVNYYLNLDFNGRELIGDNQADLTETGYGNNDVEGPEASHGTHCAGIIGAVRNNGVGINGVAQDVQLMSVRVVPDGDEYDKDVANAIRYAVDNGAQVISMSFGKSYSAYPQLVKDALSYASSKNVVLVHAAGNDSKNIDKNNNYPGNENAEGERIAGMITVGANAWEANENLPATFSNYGAKNVDVFAPGVAIVSTIPQSEYAAFNGTSMACPVVSGIAATLLSYYPSLTNAQIAEIIAKSSVNLGGEKVVKPTNGKEKQTKFKKLSVTGGVANLYNALLLAEEMSK